LASGNLQSTASSESHVSFTLYDHLTGRATVYNDNDRIAESSIASRLRGSGKVPTQDNSLRQLMLSDNKVSGAIFGYWQNFNDMHVFTENCI
jgi:hypothetical protein